MNSSNKINDTIEKISPFIFPKYGARLEGTSVKKEFLLSDKEVQMIQKIGKENPLGEMSIVLSGVLLFLWRCQSQSSIAMNVAINQNQYHPFQVSIEQEDSLKDFLIKTQKHFFEYLSTTTFDIFNINKGEPLTNVCFGSDKLFHDQKSTDHALSIQFIEGNKLSVSYVPSQVGEDFISHVKQGLTAFFEGLKDSSQKLKELSFYPITIQKGNDLPSVPSFIEQFTEVAEKYPEAKALVGKEMQFTYQQLDAKSNQLARHIRNEYKISNEASVAVLMDNSVAAFLSLFAILKAGGTYVPIDPSWPSERIQQSLELAEVKLVITQSYHLENIQFNCPIFAMDFQIDMLQEASDSLDVQILDTSRAYILFTSGTTGTPRGVEIEQGSLANMLFDQKTFMSLNVGDRFAQPFAPTFDASILSMGVTLLKGATLVPIPKEHLSPKKIEAFFGEYQINIATFVPSVLRSLPHDALENVTTLICGGEKILPTDIELYAKDKRFINSYGTTETTCCVCTREYNVASDEINNISAGKPVSGMSVLILDDTKKSLLQGMIGEVWVGGRNLARGYLKSQEETAKSFIQNPYNEQERLYRTGDLGRITTNGEVEILGRTDRQIKVNGQRIEPFEIEALLTKHPEVKAAHVDLLTKEEEIFKVVAFLAVETRIEQDVIKSYLKKYVPLSWVPNEFIQLVKLPNTSIGKVDVEQLKKIWIENSHQEVSSEEKESLSKVELQLVDLWKDIFQVEAIDVKENFFSYGGHSLLAIQLLSNIQEVFHVEVALGTFLANPTIQFLSSQIRESTTGTSSALQMIKAPESDVSPITSSQKGFWIQNQLNASSRNHITRCYKIDGQIDIEKLKEALDILAERHDAFRMRFKLTDNGEPSAIFNHHKGYKIEEINSEDSIMIDAIQEEHHQLFDLENDPLVRIVHFIGSETSFLTFTVHHIALDGWSIAILLQELQTLYKGEKLTPLEYNLRDCLYSYQEYIKSETFQETREEWKEKLQNYHNKELIKTDITREGNNHKSEHKTMSFQISEAICQRLKSFGSENRISDFGVLVAALTRLMQSESGENTVRFGTPNAGRIHPEFESQIGCFLNLLVLQLNAASEDSFYDLVAKASDDVIWSIERAQIGFADVVNDVGYDATKGRHPLFDIEIDYRSKQINANPDQIHLGSVILEKYEKAKPSGGKFDFDFLFTERDTDILFELCYNASIFNESTAQRVAKNFLTILEESLHHPEKKLKELILEKPVSNGSKSLRDKRKSRLLGRKKSQGLSIISPEIRTPNSTGETLAERLEKDAKGLKQELSTKKAVLYRGFELKDEENFQKAVLALGDQPFDYIEKSSPRRELKQGVYTSTEHPKDQEIKLHCEHSYSFQWPQRLIFSCLVPAQEGGGTTLADAQAVVNILPEQVIEKFKKEGIMYVRNFGNTLGLHWSHAFKTDKKSEVEAYCNEHHIKYEWWGDQNLKTYSRRPAFRPHPVTGELMWFNHSYFFNPKSLDKELYDDLMEYCDYDTLPFNTFYGDGQEIEPEIFSKIKTALDETKMTHFWQQGDFLILDNMLVAHGRTPYEGDRKIVLAMTQVQVDNSVFKGE